MSLSGTLKAAFWGAVTGAVTYGIGSCFQTGAGVATAFSKTFGGVMVKAAAHGISQGTLAMMQNNGAGFLSGAAGGFFGSLGATAWGGAGGKWGGIAGKYAGSDVGTIAFGALSGGVGAELSGGNFWQGAIAGGIVAGLNDVMHKMGDDGGIDPPGKKRPDADGKITLGEANDWFRNGNGEPLYADLAKIDLSFVSASDFKGVGDIKTFQSLFKSDAGFTYGNITLKYEGGTRVSVTKGYHDTYNFERHNTRSNNPNILSRIKENSARAFRNFATVGGRMLADRFPMNRHNQEFKIYFYGYGKISK